MYSFYVINNPARGQIQPGQEPNSRYFQHWFSIAVSNMNTFVLYNGKNLEHYTKILFSKWNFYKFRISYNFILPGIMSLIGSRKPIAAGRNVFTFNSPDAALKIRLIEKMKVESR